MAAKISAVFDTVIFVRCLLNPRSLWGRLVFGNVGRYRLIVSRPVLWEIFEVLDRPEIVRNYRFVAGMGKQQILTLLADAEIVDVPSVPSVSRDVKDDKFLATAKAAKADYLVTEDNDLLVLGKYDGTRIVDAAAFHGILARDGIDPNGS